MRVILTVIGKDKVGIIAGVSQKLAELEINILDVSQTIMDDYFTMMMMLTMDKSSDFETIRKELNQVGESLGVSIKVQNEEIFNAMHKL
ncbi:MULTISPECIES: ACT domain-containing protein [Enterococcus]|uniref:UPF0237 protein BAU18_001702 n=1 Tax=Enterococcus diestrammenae TaxID=1155073 RepID=A0ABV0F247_9ENTE|nr:ACT domain-containing protein [Enterococcus diestrammenae]KAF1295347.1 hypothetical protein BAU18_11155 [Enterococcus diestrammenae]HIX70240.1 ACT domain-containing protein [Candidatus Enterococcus stercoravium]